MWIILVRSIPMAWLRRDKTRHFYRHRIRHTPFLPWLWPPWHTVRSDAVATPAYVTPTTPAP